MRSISLLDTPASPQVLHKQVLRGGDAWSHILKRGTSLTLIDIEGGANAGVLVFNFEIPSERYNMPDTLKAQHTAKLTAGHVLYSDMGRILCSITEDTLGWHDPLGGHGNSSQARAKFGEATYQQVRNDFIRNAHDNFVIEAEKYGLSLRDLPANINFFSKVQVDLDGSLSFIENHSQPASSVTLRAEMNTLVILDTNPHPLAPGREYKPKPVEILITKTPSPNANDFCFTSCPENGRGFQNTQMYFL